MNSRTAWYIIISDIISLPSNLQQADAQRSNRTASATQLPMQGPEGLEPPTMQGSEGLESTPPPPDTFENDPMAAALNADDDDHGTHEAGWVDVTENASDDSDLASCAERWRAAGPESRKKMFSLFAACGIFVAVCRHGHLLVLCDIIKSGEL